MREDEVLSINSPNAVTADRRRDLPSDGFPNRRPRTRHKNRVSGNPTVLGPVGFLQDRVIPSSRPNGIVCLKSAVRFHGLLPLDSASIWMAIDSKAKKPVAGGLKLRFVRFSGQALTQGVENIRIDGVPVRIYSAAKTIADCLKYRKKLGGNLAVKVLRESIDRRKCSEQRLRHFARICRVRKLVHAAYSLVARA